MNIQSGLGAGFNAESYDALVVGCGYAGSVCARRLAARTSITLPTSA